MWCRVEVCGWFFLWRKGGEKREVLVSWLHFTVQDYLGVFTDG